MFAREGFKLCRVRAAPDSETVSPRWWTAVGGAANARPHPPGSTTARYGRRRIEGAKKPAASSASRIGLPFLI